MLNSIGDFLIRIGGILKGLSRRPTLEEREMLLQKERCRPWFEANGDKTLRLNYDLTSSSIVFDVGGYEGQWASDIYAKYNCRILIFEPYHDHYNFIVDRFVSNHQITVYPFGLADRDDEVKFFVCKDGSSQHKKFARETIVQIRSLRRFIDENEITEIDLMKINIEGGEYDLLDHIIQEECSRMIKNIQVQFHSFIHEAEHRMTAIQEGLSKTHRLTYQYKYVWENWQIKK